MALPRVAVLKVVRGSQILDIFWRQNWQVLSFLFFFRPNVGCERKESRMIPTCLTQTSSRINATWEGKTRNLALDIKICDVNQILTNWTISRGRAYTFTYLLRFLGHKSFGISTCFLCQFQSSDNNIFTYLCKKLGGISLLTADHQVLSMMPANSLSSAVLLFTSAATTFCLCFYNPFPGYWAQ